MMRVTLNLGEPLRYQNMIKSSDNWNLEMKINNIPTKAMLRTLHSCSFTKAKMMKPILTLLDLGFLTYSSLGGILPP